MNPLIITEGNIGSGKTTASKQLARRLNLRQFEEPVDEELLTLFYGDIAKWAFAFQIEMLHRRWATQMAAASETLVSGGYRGAILDRSLLGDLVFCRVLHEDGMIHKKEFEIYLTAVRNMSLVLFPPTILIYLSARPETCMERIKERNRPQEKDITISYLNKIHNGYQKLLKEAKTAMFPWSHAVNTMVIPWDAETATDREWDRTAEMVEEAIGDLRYPS